MISKAVELALAAGALIEADLLALNDWTLLERLRAVPAARGLIERLDARALLKRAYVISARTVGLDERRQLVERYHQSADRRGAVEARLTSELGAAAGEVIVYCPALTVMKEAAARVVTAAGLRALNDPDDPATAEIRALEARYAELWRLYVFTAAEHAERAGALAASLFGKPNEYR